MIEASKTNCNTVVSLYIFLSGYSGDGIRGNQQGRLYENRARGQACEKGTN